MPTLVSKGGAGVKYVSVLVSLISFCSPCAFADDSEISVNPYELVDLESEANVGIRTSYEGTNIRAAALEAHSEIMIDGVEESECSENSMCP